MNEVGNLVFIFFNWSVLDGYITNQPKFDPRMDRSMSSCPRALVADHFPLNAPRGTFYRDRPGGLWHSLTAGC